MTEDIDTTDTNNRHRFGDGVAAPRRRGRARSVGVSVVGLLVLIGVSACGATALVGQISREATIDPRRVDVTGMSNGAMLAGRLACETTIFAATASVAGAQMVDCDDPSITVSNRTPRRVGQ